ncbi:MAG: outer membrane protein transport protein [Ignavibacteriales bacterium]|nr:outer membrane protein transport protein [Ignavibacteriales bacterium]
MKSSRANILGVMLGVVVLSCSSIVSAQPAAGPLDIQGLDHFVITGARARAMGGASIANSSDVTALFANPAALSQLTTLEIRVGGLFENNLRKQDQNWIPTKDLPSLSVLFEGLTGYIKPLDGSVTNPWDNVQRPYDNIGPNWSTTSSKTRPLTLAAALPLTFEGMKVTPAIGISQVIDLDNYYQNNNSMAPYVGQERPFDQWSNSVDTIHIKWYQFFRSREGSVYGITPGLSVMFLSGLTIGGSVALLSGSSDDLEQRVERGHLNVAVGNGKAKDFLLDTVYYYQTKTGTSTYSGTLLTLGLLYKQPAYSIGITVKPAMTVFRTWDRDVISIDTTNKPFPVRIDSLRSRSYHENGKDDVKFPLAYSVGFVLTPNDRWTFAFDYEIRNLGNVEWTSQTNSTAAHPWANNSANWRLGAEYRVSDMLAVRGGYHEDIQSFAPDGSAIVDKPTSGEIYSLGAGVALGNIFIDLAYEYSILKYQDIYQSNINYSTREQHQFMMEIAYRF